MFASLNRKRAGLCWPGQGVWLRDTGNSMKLGGEGLEGAHAAHAPRALPGIPRLHPGSEGSAPRRMGLPGGAAWAPRSCPGGGAGWAAGRDEGATAGRRRRRGEPRPRSPAACRGRERRPPPRPRPAPAAAAAPFTRPLAIRRGAARGRGAPPQWDCAARRRGWGRGPAAGAARCYAVAAGPAARARRPHYAGNAV